jgi:uncharacterized protein
MLLTLIIGYVVFVAVVALTQRRLIYFPARFAPATAEARAAQNGLSPWRNASGGIIGWQMRARGASTASVLVVHGNAGSAADRDYLARSLHDAEAVDVFVLEYPGYGARGGEPSRSSFLAAGEEAFVLLPSDRPRYLVGESLGAGVVAHLAGARPGEVAGLALLVPFHNLPWVAQRQMPFLPANWLLRDRFSPVDDLKHYRGPVKVVIAGHDEVIPAESGRRLFDAYEGPKDLQVFPGARHNDVAGQSPEWWREVFAFWRTNAPVKSP